MSEKIIKPVTPLFDVNGYPIIRDNVSGGFKDGFKSTILKSIIDKLPDISDLNVENFKIQDNYILVKMGERVPVRSVNLIDTSMNTVITAEIIKVGKKVAELKVGDTILDYSPARGGMIVVKGVIYQSIREDNAVLWISK